MHSGGPARVCRRPAGAHVPPACERLPCTGRHDPDSTGLCTVFTNGTTKRAIAADAVDRPVARGRHQPAARVGGRPVAGPALGGGRERLLRGFLGEVEVAEEADQARKDAAPLVAEDLLEDRYRSTIGRTSTAPPMRAAGMRAASSIAASR